MKTPANPGSTAVPCQFETLEGRLLLSGDVTAVFKSGNLTILGDVANNTVDITQETFLVDQATVTRTTITGIDDTKVNGKDAEFFDNVTGNVTVKMGLGDDMVVLRDVLFSKKVTLDDSGGSSTVDLTRVQVQDLLIRNKLGSDVLTVDDLTVLGNMAVDNQKGGSSTNINRAIVGKGMKVSNKDGADTVLVSNTDVAGNLTLDNQMDFSNVTAMLLTVGGNLQIKGGLRGDDLVTLSDVAVQGFAKVFVNDGTCTGQISGSIFHGGLQYKAVRGDNDLTVTGVAADKAILLQTGDGDDMFTVDDLTANAAFSLSSGRGADTILVETAGDPDGAPSTFVGAVSVRTDRGNDVLVVGEADSLGRRGTFLGRVSADGGTDPGHTDFDALDSEGHGNTFAIVPVARNFENDQ